MPRGGHSGGGMAHHSAPMHRATPMHHATPMFHPTPMHHSTPFPRHSFPSHHRSSHAGHPTVTYSVPRSYVPPVAPPPEINNYLVLKGSPVNITKDRIRKFSWRDPTKVLFKSGSYVLFCEVDYRAEGHVVDLEIAIRDNSTGSRHIVERVDEKRRFVYEFDLVTDADAVCTLKAHHLLHHTPVTLGFLKREPAYFDPTQVSLDDVTDLYRLEKMLLAGLSINGFYRKTELNDISTFRLNDDEKASRRALLLNLETTERDHDQFSGVTLLHVAAYLVLPDALNFLMQNGADPNLLTPRRRMTAYDILRERNASPEILALVPQYRAVSLSVRPIALEFRIGETYKCTSDLEGRPPTELSVKKGQRVRVIDLPDRFGWVLSELDDATATAGMLPAWIFTKDDAPDEEAPPPPANPRAFGQRDLKGVKELAGKFLRVAQPFDADEEDEITVSSGDIVVALENPTKTGWIKVQLSRPGNNSGENFVRFGFVPLSYLDRMEEPKIATTSEGRPISLVDEQHAECPICFEEMHLFPLAVFRTAFGSRTCRHFLHLTCAQNVADQASHMNCPICRASFAYVEPLPDFAVDPRKWFKVVDRDGNGTLSKTEVLDVFKASLSIDYNALEQEMDGLWKSWTSGDQSTITFDQLCSQSGLLAYVRRNYALMDLRRKNATIPLLAPSEDSKAEWFRYFDENSNGALSFEEMLGALSKTYNFGAEPEMVQELRSILTNLWPSMVGRLEESCSLAAFVAEGGVGDYIGASFADFDQEEEEKANLGRALLRQANES